MKKYFSKVIKSKDLQSITIDIVEKTLDSQISDDVLKNIPIVKSLIAVRNIFSSYSDVIFIRKAMHVLLELSDVNFAKRMEFINELDNDYQSGTELILMAIDKLDNIQKCLVFGRLCKLKANEIISNDIFFKINKSCARCLS